ncbi:MAG TPA: acyl carrier protein [Thermoanaerobaculia bacterium]|nr:acyl carrier protein [Thermoanaerobaculia bacterium]
MEIDQTLREILRAHGAPDGVGRAASLTKLGLDSIAIAEVLLAVEDRFSIRIAADFVAGEPLTFGRLADHVRALVASS